jgi:hypothetical protein
MNMKSADNQKSAWGMDEEDRNEKEWPMQVLAFALLARRSNQLS